MLLFYQVAEVHVIMGRVVWGGRVGVPPDDNSYRGSGGGGGGSGSGSVVCVREAVGGMCKHP
jgi:hypothetical protein